MKKRNSQLAKLWGKKEKPFIKARSQISENGGEIQNILEISFIFSNLRKKLAEKKVSDHEEVTTDIYLEAKAKSYYKDGSKSWNITNHKICYYFETF